MSDLVKRLEDHAYNTGSDLSEEAGWELEKKGAEIERLQAENERLEDLLSQCWATCCDSLTTTHVRIQEIASILREKPAALKEQT